MSIVGAAGELTPAELAERVLTLAPFRRVTQDQFRGLLQHLLQIDHLEKTEEGGLILGLAGEKVVRNFRFLATFQEVIEWTVKDGSREVGTISDAVPVGERFALAGRTWEVVELAAEQRIIIARRVKGGVRALFSGACGGELHDRVVERMRQVLVEDGAYPYLTERAKQRTQEARQLARAAALAKGPTLLAMGGDQLCLLPWCGTRKLATMQLKLDGLPAVRSIRPDRFYLTLTAETGGTEPLVAELTSITGDSWDGGAMVAGLDRIHCERAKYDEYLPESLLKEGFVVDHLDAAGAEAQLRRCLRARSAPQPIA